MSFPKYPAYKDSGLKWIGEVPTGWSLSQLSFVFENISSGTTPSTNDDEYYRGNIPWVTTGELREAEIFSTEKNISSEALNVFSALKIYPPGTLLVAMYGATTGRLGWLGVDATTNQACCALAYPKNVHFKFIFYSLLNAKEALLLLSSGGGQPNINQEKIRSFRIPIPPLPEQQAIVSFLDRECGKIDGLIAEQERLIALLAEKRQAVISHAVTKGLNPNAPMKDSGIPWIGMVPEEWEVKCLRYVCDFEQGKAHEPFFDDDGEFICATARFVSTSGSSFKRCNTCLTKAEKRDILMVMSDLPNGRALARAFLVTENNIAINQRICKIVPRIGNECFYYYQLDRNQGLLKYDDKVNQTHLSNNAYKALPLIVPPLDEQNRIASYLQTFDEENVRLNQELLGSLILLKERRAALISAAVTGKIDVRAQSKAIAA